MMLRHFTLVVTLVSSISLVSAASNCRQPSNSDSRVMQLIVPAKKIYSFGAKTSSRVLYLSHESYLRAVKQNQIPIDSILILDSLPGEVDVPFVSAIILKNPLSGVDAHNQILAQKLGIPLLQAEGDRTFSYLKGWNGKEGTYFRVSCLPTGCIIELSKLPFPNGSVKKSIFPISTDRNALGFKTTFGASRDDKIDPDDAREPNFEPIRSEIYGEKFRSLSYFAKGNPGRVPPTVSVSTGVFEKFLDFYKYKGEKLRDIVKRTILLNEEATLKSDEEAIKRNLQELRESIVRGERSGLAENADIFGLAAGELKRLFGNMVGSDQSISVRSNNDVEDLIAAGLYESGVAKNLSMAEIERVFKKVWASMYEYRAYVVRRARGQIEENLSMPPMVHPYIAQKAHAVMRVKLDGEGQLSGFAQVKVGLTDKATNPTDSPTVTVWIRHSGDRNIVQVQGGIESAMIAELENFFGQTNNFFINELTNRAIDRKSIDLEIVWNQDDGKIQVLQYKPNYDPLIVESILNGETKRSQLDLVAFPGQDIESMRKMGIFSFIDNADVEQVMNDRLRYALIRVKGEYRIIFWGPLEHQSVRKKIDHSGATWLRSGMVSINKNAEGRYSLGFSDTPHKENDPVLPVENLKIFFSEAKEQLKSNGKFWGQLEKLGIQSFYFLTDHREVEWVP